MVCGIHKLTQRECLIFIKKTKDGPGKKGLLGDGGGLYLRALSTGTASWVFRYELDGQSREHGLGSFATFDLAEVREKARRCRQQIHEGIDPVTLSKDARAARRAAAAAIAAAAAPPPPSSPTFKYCALKFMAFKEAGWTNDKHRRDWENSLERFAYPILGHRPVDTITVDDVMAVLEPNWVKITETMMRVRGRIEQILTWAATRNPPLRSGANPATWKGNLEMHLNAKARKATKHFAALGYEQIHELVTDLQENPDIAGDALLFTLLNAARSKETRLAAWSEINFKTAVWDRPADHMKARLPHRVPLSEAALAVLRRQPTYAGDDNSKGLIFCGSQMEALSETPMLERLQRRFPEMTVHGSVRAGFSTWSADVDKTREEVREAALAHGGDAVVEAYKRSDHLADRRGLMERWAAHCLGEGTNEPDNNVVPLVRAA